MESTRSAKRAGLTYVTGRERGFERRRRGKKFAYFTAGGAPLRNSTVLRRIASLGIPPAWTQVWICASPSGHLQATGRDARDRKQYRYHLKWRASRDETKFERMLEFAHALPAIRARTGEHLRHQTLTREKVLATVVQLLERTLIRVGNDEYAQSNDSYGLTTLRDKHVEVRGDRLKFDFRGKSGKRHVIGLTDPKLARIIRQCQHLPGQELFHYLDGDRRARRVHSNDVNAYLREISGEDFTAKDFRTWAGTVEAAHVLRGATPASPPEAKKQLVEMVKTVADKLGNTPAVCRKSYIHPHVMDLHLSGGLQLALAGRVRPPLKLRAEELGVVSMLRKLHKAPPSARRRAAA